MLEYKRDRTDFTEEAHGLAKELTEAVNAYLNEEKGDEIKESLDVGMVIGAMLMSGEDRHENIEKLINGIMLFAINAGKSALEESTDPPQPPPA